MKKDSLYFPHDCNARGDEKILRVLKDMKWEGYGLYWAIIEKLHEAGGWLREDIDTIAFDLRAECERIRYLMHDFDLFIFKDGLFSSNRVLANIAFRNSKSIKASQSAITRWANRAGNQPKYANALQTQSEGNAINEINETKGKKRKKEEYSAKTDLAARKPPHTEFMDRFKASYEAMTNQPFEFKKEQFIIVKRLIDKHGYDAAVEKVKILGILCRDRSQWFTRDQWSDFTIEKLSKHWNAILPTITETPAQRKDREFAETIKRQEEKDARLDSAINVH